MEFLLEIGRVALIIIGILVVVIVVVAMLDRHERPKNDAERDKTAAEFSKGESGEGDGDDD